MNDSAIREKIRTIESDIEKMQEQLADYHRQLEPKPVEDYLLLDGETNEISLSALFKDKNDLLVIHNMGTGCPYCTLWADGFTGLYPHINSRAAFALVSPDNPAVMKSFTTGRGWNFPCYSSFDKPFAADMGYYDIATKRAEPGVSSFWKDSSGAVFRIDNTYFGPGDLYCALWPLFNLLKEGVNNWDPKYSYVK